MYHRDVPHDEQGRAGLIEQCARIGASCVLLASLCIPASRAIALPVAFLDDDGTSREVLSISPGEPVTTRLWLDAEAEILGATLSIGAGSGLELLEFLPAAALSQQMTFDLRADRLSTQVGNGLDLIGPFLQLGSLTLLGTTPGARLLLDVLPGVETPSIVLDDFEIRDLQVPQVLAVVGEVPAASLLCLALLGLVLRQRVRCSW